MIRTNLCDYSDACIPACIHMHTISVPNTATQGAAVNNTTKGVILKNCSRFTKYIT